MKCFYDCKISMFLTPFHLIFHFSNVADDMSVPVKGDQEIRIAGANSILPKEHGSQSFNLPIVKYCEKEVHYPALSLLC